MFKWMLKRVFLEHFDFWLLILLTVPVIGFAIWETNRVKPYIAVVEEKQFESFYECTNDEGSYILVNVHGKTVDQNPLELLSIDEETNCEYTEFGYKVLFKVNLYGRIEAKCEFDLKRWNEFEIGREYLVSLKVRAGVRSFCELMQ